MENKYYVTQEQLADIEHYRRMFDYTADQILDLCNGEKDDVVYGFELGRVYSHLKDHFMNMFELTNTIRDQKIENGKQ